MSQKSQLNQLILNQDKKNKQLDEFRYALIVAMYRSLIDHESYVKRVKKLYQIRFNQKLPVSDKAIRLAIQFYNRIEKRKRVYDKNGVLIVGSVAAAYLIHHYNVSDNIKTVIFEEQRKQVGETKEAIIMSDIQDNRENGIYFYLCSRHDDCAKDHVDYQGKLYIDAYCQDEEALKFAKKHNLKQYQWVIDAPVYMVTRPNCRHYFKALSLAEVMGSSVKDLIKKYDMTHKIGPRTGVQTLRTKGQKVEYVIKSYEDRLRVHNMMYKIRPNDFLKSAIDKDHLLIKKWKKKL